MMDNCKKQRGFFTVGIAVAMLAILGAVTVGIETSDSADSNAAGASPEVSVASAETSVLSSQPKGEILQPGGNL